MKPCRHALRDAHGLTLVELLVAAAIFIFVAFGMGSLYLSAKRGFDFGSAEAFVQRQGTLVQEELARHILRATLLQVAQCRPNGSVTIAAGESIIYQRLVQDPTSGALQNEYWCIYWFQRTSPADPYPQLWRCRIAGPTPPQNCTSTPENLLPPVPASISGQLVSVSSANFAVPLSCVGVTCVATSVDIRFDLDLRDGATGPSLLWSARRFGFNTTIRN